MNEPLNTKAQVLRSLHRGPVLVLPNAWDAASAALLARAGARAIGTTSGGIAWAHGQPDGQHITREAMAQAVELIVRAVDIPVTADMEGGYGPAPADVEATVSATIAAGAAGMNLEDSGARGGPLFSVEAQAERIGAARAAARACGAPDFVVNARTDVFLFRIGEPGGRLDEVRRRGEAYAEAGADCLFVPGLLDLGPLRSLVDSMRLPVNAMAGPGGPSVAELAAAGVRRISVGTALAQAAYGTALRAARELVTSGTFEAFDGAIAFSELNGLFER